MSAPYATPHGARRLPRSPLSGRELGMLAAFWALFAVFRVADQVFTAPDLPTVARWLVPQLAQALFWTVATPIVFASVERVSRRRRPLVVSVALYVALGGACAAAASGVGQGASLPPPPPRAASARVEARGPARPQGPRPGPFWARFGYAASLYLAVLAAALARVSALRARSQREQTAVLAAQLAEARLDALRRQLDPHFLFNTHAVVASLIEPDPAGARRMLARLSEFLRATLRDAGGQEVSLAQELALVDLYLDIMRVRYEGRLDVETRVEPAAGAALVPSLVLQPLVENAIKHGVERRPGRARLVISAAREHDALVLRVRDGGAGVGSAPGADPSDAPGGVGLRNTTERLRHLYGPAATLTLDSAPGGGTEAVVRLPFHTAAVRPPSGPNALGH